MSPDGNEPDIPPQRPGNANWGQSFEHAHQVDHDALPPLPDSGQEEVFDSGTPPSAEEMNNWNYESDQADQFASSAAPFAFLKQPDRYIPIILAPLLFAVLTILLVFALINTHKTFISPAGFLPIILVAIAVAVAQGVAAYAIGSDNGIWALTTIGGFCLFLLIGIFAIFGIGPTVILFCVFVVLFIILRRFYLHSVAEGYVDIVYSVGKYSRTFYPGPSFLLPWEKVAHTLNVGEKQWVCPLQKVQLSRDEDVVLRATISYQLMPADAYLAVTRVNQWEEILKELVVSTLQSIATTFMPDDFIAWPQGLHSRPLTYDNTSEKDPRWERINKYLQDTIGDHVALWGVVVNWIHIRDISLAPHGATIVETDAVFDMPTTIIEHPAPPVAVAPKQPAAQAPKPKAPVSQPETQKSTKNSGNANLAEETTQAVPVPPPAQDVSRASQQLPNEKSLIGLYTSVQQGKITDPATIRQIASQFEMIAHNPDARNTVSFDADRASQILYGWAQKNDPLFAAENNDETKPDWAVRRPNDENLMAGG
jgi:SPFH domain / Band 7 family